jgi:prefoldin subunit 5
MRIAKIDITSQKVKEILQTNNLRSLKTSRTELLLVIDSQLNLKGMPDNQIKLLVYDLKTRKLIPETTEASLEDLKIQKEAQIRSTGNSKLTALATPYLPQERETWGTQIKEAEAFLQDPTSLTPMLDSLASARGILKADLIEKVIANANLFKQESGSILGTQQKLLDQLSLASTNEEVSQINWI